VKVKETVSDEAHEDPWGLPQTMQRTEKSDYFQRGPGRWTSQSDHRWRTRREVWQWQM